MTWYRAFGTASLPIRQSALGDYGTQYGCPKRFAFRMEEEISGEERAMPTRLPWRTGIGTAVHETLRRALTVAGHHICAGHVPSREQVLAVLAEELERAAEGREVDWRKDDPEKQVAGAVEMVLGAIRTLGQRARRIVAVEAPFSLELEGYSLTGTIDLLYEPIDGAPGDVVLADWKTGERRMDEIIRDHGYQVGVYAAAVEHGRLWPGTAEEMSLGCAPRDIFVVHLRDFIPYVRAPRKALEGQPRGPGWYRSNRRADDVARLRVSLRSIVGAVRLGRFPECLGEQCRRCPYRIQCLGEGHGPDARALAQVESALREIDALAGE